MSTEILDAPPAEAPRWRIVNKLVNEHREDTGESQEMWLVALNREIPFRMNDNPGEYGMADHVVVVASHIHKAFGVEEFWYDEFCVVPSDEKGVAESAFIYKTSAPIASQSWDADTRDEDLVRLGMFSIGML